MERLVYMIEQRRHLVLLELLVGKVRFIDPFPYLTLPYPISCHVSSSIVSVR